MIPVNTLFVIERENDKGQYVVSDSNPSRSERRKYKFLIEDLAIENYSDTRDINIQMLLADGWDAVDLLRQN